MIVDAILLILQGAINIILSPFTVLNIAIDFISSIPVFVSFLQVVAYLMPWSNILPIIILNIGIVLFKIGVSVVKTIWDLLPIL